MKPIISVEWLKENINNPNLVVLYSNLGDKTSPTHYIPNSRLFDIKNVFSDTSSSLPNTFPSVQQFQDKCQVIGINQKSIIVVYDSRNTFSSPRVWWMFKTMGHQMVAVLDGGLQAWEKGNFAYSKKLTTTFTKGNFQGNLHENSVKNFDFIKQNLITQKALIIDARSADRFLGKISETRKGLRSGHIPNAINLPYSTVLKEGKFKSVSELKKIFKTIPKQKPLVFSCGSGVTACIILLAAQYVLKNEMSIYDGSWTEWASLEKA